MFEQESKLEDRSASLGPIALIVAICLTVVGTAAYVLHEARRGMSEAEAKHAVASMLAQHPSVLHFRTGLVTATVNDKPSAPHYKILQAAQVIAMDKKDNGVQVTLTEGGQKLLASIAGVSHNKLADGTEEYSVPLGTKEVVQVTNVNVLSPSAATIHYTWQWRPTAMGDVFDLAGGYVSGLDVWERAELAKEGADLFHTAPVTDDYNATSGWQIASN